MFKDESGRLANVPSVDTLRKAMQERGCGTEEACCSGKTVTKSLIDQIGETVRGRPAEARLTRTEDDVRKYVLKEFARTGKPPSGKAIAQTVKLPSPEAALQIVEKLS